MTNNNNSKIAKVVLIISLLLLGGFVFIKYLGSKDLAKNYEALGLLFLLEGGILFVISLFMLLSKKTSLSRLLGVTAFIIASGGMFFAFLKGFGIFTSAISIHALIIGLVALVIGVLGKGQLKFAILSIAIAIPFSIPHVSFAIQDFLYTTETTEEDLGIEGGEGPGEMDSLKVQERSEDIEAEFEDEDDDFDFDDDIEAID